jgi:hypothetical protein
MIDEKKLIEVMLKCREREHGTPKGMIDWFISVIEACPKLDENLFNKKKLIEDIDSCVAGLTNIQIMQIADIIETQPKVGEWIPVSERLPKEDRMVLCTEKDTGILYLGFWLNIEDVEVRWFDADGFSMDVVAWMPLPEPYKGVEE